MVRTMLIKRKIANIFWKEIVHIVVYIQNRCLLRPHENKTQYELWIARKAIVRYFKVFGSKCYIKITNENLGKFEHRVDEGIFLSYSIKSKAYKFYNKRMRKIVDSADVKVDEKEELPKIDDDNFPIYKEIIEGDEEEKIEKDSKNDSKEEELEENKKFKTRSWKKDNPKNKIIGDPKSGI